MKKYTLLLTISLLLNSAVFGGSALVEFSQTANNANLIVQGKQLIAPYVVKNNTPYALKLSPAWSGKNGTVQSSCNNILPANGFCAINVFISPNGSMGSFGGTLSIDYGYRGPLTASLSLDSQCQLLPVYQFQSSFCQQQFTIILSATQNIFYPANINVKDGQRLGGVFGSYQQGQQCYTSCGYTDLSFTKHPDEQTIFEIASMTKTFTATILGLKEFLNEIAPGDNVDANLPLAFNLTANESAVTYQQLATFSGGFYYSDPPNYPPQNPPYTQADFVTAINQLDPGNSPSVPAYSVQPPQYLPSFNVYSNSSYGLLGQSLAYIDFPTEAFSPGVLNALFCRYILNPLNMTRTNVCVPSVTLNGQCTSFNQICSAQADWSNTMEFTQGSSVKKGRFTAVNPFPWVPWAAAGAIRSNAEDMVKYLMMLLGDTPNPDLIQGANIALSPNDYLPVPMGETTKANHPVANTPNLQAYAWVVSPPPASNPQNIQTVKFKLGGHEGYNSFIGVVSSKNYGIIILTNTGPDANGILNPDLNASLQSIGLNIAHKSTNG